MKDYEVMIIRRYTGKIADVVVTRYTAGDRPEFRVGWRLRDPDLRDFAGDSAWFNNKTAAILHAQFLAGRL